MKNKSPSILRNLLSTITLTSLLASCADYTYDHVLTPGNILEYAKRKGLGAAGLPNIPLPQRRDQVHTKPHDRPHSTTRHPGAVNIIKGKFKEPSGICWHRGRGTLFAVGDEGDIIEMRTDGAIINRGHIRGADLEGITTNPATGMLYTVWEGAEKIIEIHPGSLRAGRVFQVPRTYRGRTVMKEGGNGIEGITFVPNSSHPQGGTFCVANQGSNKLNDYTGIYFVELPIRTGSGKPRIVGHFTPVRGDIAGLHYDSRNKRLNAISNNTDTLLVYSSSHRLISKAPLPGRHQEGITFDDAGNMYIAQDSGGILKLRRP